MGDTPGKSLYTGYSVVIAFDVAIPWKPSTGCSVVPAYDVAVQWKPSSMVGQVDVEESWGQVWPACGYFNTNGQFEGLRPRQNLRAKREQGRTQPVQTCQNSSNTLAHFGRVRFEWGTRSDR